MRHYLSTAILLAATLLGSTGAIAQSNIEGRVGRLESEMNAVQRKVFPGGSGQYFEPQITPGRTEQEPLPGTPSSSPVADLTVRVNALEQQMSTLTGQIEESQHRVQVLEGDFTAYKRATDARLSALEGGAPAGTGGPASFDNSAPRAGEGNFSDRPAGSFSGRPSASNDDIPPRGGAAPVVNDPAALTDVERPATGDAADDAYVFGYRLWAAKHYPEAEAQLKSVVAKYPTNRRASWAQNLLGRTYLDEGKPSLASIAFYDNYKKMPDGERAPDSLYYLAQALIQLKKPADACKVYGELSDVYGDKISAAMKSDIARGRGDLKCK